MTFRVTGSVLARQVALAILLVTAGNVAFGQSATVEKRIMLVAGETAKIDAAGHHDYLAGCECLNVLLSKTAGIKTVRVNGGWPDNDSAFDGISSVVFYTDGGGKQAFLSSPQRVAKIQELSDAGVGLVMIHQAVDFTDEFVEQAKGWIGGVYQKGKSGRGHWPSSHVDFPEHPVSFGVTPWQINDGWLNGLQFVDEMKGITPLVWSGKDYDESRAGLNQDIVGWGYERPRGGRSFAFTGLDAHSAWSLDGVRQLMVNGVLWSAGVDIPEGGAESTIDEEELKSMLTPREPKKPAPKKSVKAS